MSLNFSILPGASVSIQCSFLGKLEKSSRLPWTWSISEAEDKRAEAASLLVRCHDVIFVSQECVKSLLPNNGHTDQGVERTVTLPGTTRGIVTSGSVNLKECIQPLSWLPVSGRDHFAMRVAVLQLCTELAGSKSNDGIPGHSVEL